MITTMFEMFKDIVQDEQHRKAAASAISRSVYRITDSINNKSDSAAQTVSRLAYKFLVKDVK